MALTKVNHRMIDDEAFNVVDYGADATGVSDSSTAIQAALDAADSAGGGTVFFPAGTYLLDAPISLTSTNAFRIDGDGATIQTGSSFNLGGSNQLTNIITLQGNAAVDLTSSITGLYANFIELSSCPATEKGSRIVICDDASGSKWDTGNNNARPTHLATVDFADTTNDIMNFYPAIEFPVTVSNASTGELDSTDIEAFVYTGDIRVHITSGIRFKGSLLDIGSDPGTGGQAAGGASPYGIYLRRGVFKVESDFVHINSAIRAEECDIEVSGCDIHGSYNGNGINVFQRAIARINNCKITHARHAISIGGSTSDGASAYLNNCILGGQRYTQTSTTYPGESFGAFDTHQAAKDVFLDGCRILGGCTISNGNVRINNSHILGTTDEGAFFFKTDCDDNGILTISDTEFLIERKTPSYDQGSDGAGTRGSDMIVFDHNTAQAAAATVTGWKLNVSNCQFKISDAATYAAPQLCRMNPGSKQWAEINFINNRFYFEGTPIREVAFKGNSDGDGIFRVRGNTFYGCAITMFRDDELDDFRVVEVSDNFVFNTDTATSSFFGYGIQVLGDRTATGAIDDLIIRGNYIESAGVNGGIRAEDMTNKSVSVRDNVIQFTASSETIATGIRTSRNQNSTSVDDYVASVRGNIIRANGNTITTGISIAGLAANGGTGLPAGFYDTGDNVVQTASTDISTTGSAATTA